MNLSLPAAAVARSEKLPRGWLKQRAELLAGELYASAEKADACERIGGPRLGALHKSGLAMVAFETRHGGENLLAAEHVRELSAILRMLGAADLSVARIFEGHVNAVALVGRYGTGEQIKSFARNIANGGLSGVWGAEDAQGLHAIPSPDGWRLEGRKILASGAGLLTHPLVTASTEAGQVLFLLDQGPPQGLALGRRVDLSGWTAQGMRSSATGTVELSGLTISSRHMIGEPGDFMRQPSFSGGAWRFCAVHLGAMERLADLFRDHLVSRKRNDDPYQLQRVAQCVAATTTTRYWVERCADLLAAANADPDSVVALANLTRMVTERSALDILEAVHRGVGLSAFIRPHPIERISRDLATYLRQPAPDMAMANAARAILASSTPTADLWASSR